jgi:hypothetical protein
MTSQSPVEAIRHVMATIFAAQNALRELAPEFKWAGMGNLLGDYGELVAVQVHGLELAPPGSEGFDAFRSDGSTVQIKANHASNTIGFRGEADFLLVVHVDSAANVETIYYGPFRIVAESSSYSKRDNKRSITISKLRKIEWSRQN